MDFEWEQLDESHNYVVFDAKFRTRYHQRRLNRQTPKRKPDEFWVSIHFRWGDVETSDPNQPDNRSGLGFSDYCSCINLIKKIFCFCSFGIKIEM